MTNPDCTDRPGPAPVPQYEIQVAGRLAARWSTWFDGLTVIPAADGTTVLRGSLIDQAALHGLLIKLRDLGVPLLALRQLSTGSTPCANDAPNRRGT